MNFGLAASAEAFECPPASASRLMSLDKRPARCRGRWDWAGGM